jgi:hypothetical protein
MNHMFAYLDAGTGSMILQAIMGGFAGLMVLTRLAWQSFCSRSRGASHGETADDVAVEASC